MAKPPIPLRGYLGDERVIARFMKKVEKPADGGGGCWLWAGCRSRNLDGSFRASFRGPGNSRSASRMAYALFKGDVKGDALVLHSCDNGLCVNPDHLRLGSHKENTGDMLARGRGMLGVRAVPGTRKRGYKRPFMNRVRKLTDDAVRAIRVDERPVHEVALSHGVSETTVFNILARRRKAHVPDVAAVVAEMAVAEPGSENA